MERRGRAWPAGQSREGQGRAVHGRYLLLPAGHVGGLLGVEGVGDAAHDEDVELQLLLPLLLLPLQPLQLVLLLLTGHRGAGAGGPRRAAAAPAGLQPPGAPTATGAAAAAAARALAGAAGREPRRGGRQRLLAALLLYQLLRLLLAGRRVQHRGGDGWAQPGELGTGLGSAPLGAAVSVPGSGSARRRARARPGPAPCAPPRARGRWPRCCTRGARGASDRRGLRMLGGAAPPPWPREPRR